MKRLVALFAVTAALPTLALAQTQGTLGDSSFGSADISFNVIDTTAPLIQVTGLEDLRMDAEIGDTLTSEGLTLCIYMNQAGATYTIQIDADPLTSGQDNFPYNISYLNTIDGTFENEAVGTDTVSVIEIEQTPSYVQSCPGSVPPATLTFSLEDKTPATAIVASAAITVTVSAE